MIIGRRNIHPAVIFYSEWYDRLVEFLYLTLQCDLIYYTRFISVCSTD